MIQGKLMTNTNLRWSNPINNRTYTNFNYNTNNYINESLISYNNNNDTNNIAPINNTENKNFTVVHWNCNALSTKLISLRNYLNKENPHIMCLNET